MTMIDTIAPPARSQRLKAATTNTHDSLDKRIMSEEIFSGRTQFARFVRVQYRFHRDIESLYALPALDALIPGLSDRRRLDQIARDLEDLCQGLPAAAPPAVAGDIDVPRALGWLYVAEGSNLGGTILFKMAAKIGLGAKFGASHLAAHPDGAARHWRQFTAALDAVPLTAEQEAQVVEGANAAFRTVRGYVEEEFL
ncbi:MAG: biliverdin-producing heme oxygenase [Stenotrophomonas sp.]